MAYVQVPKDLTRVKNKVMFNLTRRQLICFSLAGITGIPFYFLTRNFLGTTVSACMMVMIMLPFFFFAMYEKDGRPLEKILLIIWRAKIQRPGIRIYQTKNFYGMLQKANYDKEVLGIDTEVKRKASGKCRRRK